MHTKFRSENLKGGDQSEDLGVAGKIIFERIIEKLGRMMWAEFICLWIGTWGRAFVNAVMNLRVP
jgi:hypothetical protein